jgi:small ligand-binding sensory domain FIST
MATIGDGLSLDDDPVRAAEAAARQAVGRLAGRRHPELVCVFACTDDRERFAEAITRVHDLTQPGALLACTAQGVLGGGQGVESVPAVSVWAGKIPKARVEGFHLDIRRSDQGVRVVGLPEVTAFHQLAVILADAHSFPIAAFVEHTNKVLPGFPFVGGLAARSGDNPAFLGLGREVKERGAIGVMLRGSFGWRAAVSQGCRPIGPAMTVTRSEGNIIYELAGTPALPKLEEIISALSYEEQRLAANGLQFGIAMDEYSERHEQGDFLVRGLVGADRDSGAILVGDVVEVGRTVGLQLRDARSAQLDLADTLAGFTGRSGLARVDGALLFSCNGRGAATFPSADHDILAVRTGLGTHGVAGFFAAGEIGPVAGANHVHGFTASILAFGVKDARAARNRPPAGAAAAVGDQGIS